MLSKEQEILRKDLVKECKEKIAFVKRTVKYQSDNLNNSLTELAALEKQYNFLENLE